MKTRLIMILALVAAVGCGGMAPSTTPSFTLDAPTSQQAAPGTSTWLDVSITPKNGFAEAVTLTASVDGPLTVSVRGQRLQVEVPRGTAPGARTVSLRGVSTSGLEANATAQLEVVRAAKAPTQALDARVRLSALFYAEGEPARVTVDFGSLPIPSVVSDVVLVSAESHDVERLSLRRLSDNTFESIETVPVHGSDAPGVALDGTFTLPPGGLFFAFLAFDPTQSGFENLEASYVSDFALLDGERAGTPTSRTEPTLALTTDEASTLPGARPTGTILRASGLGAGAPLQLATGELVLFHKDQAELTRFLTESSGTLVRTEAVEGPLPFSSLVELDPSSLTPARLALVRSLADDQGELLASRGGALAIYGLALAYRLDGYVVAVNPRLQYQAAQTLAAPELTTIEDTMRLRGTPTETRSCIPGSTARPCTQTVPALWTYLDLMDVTRQRVKVAVLDMGFAPNADFRMGEDGGIDQCDFTGRGIRCGPGAALGEPTVGASGVGDKLWHGTGVVTALGGVVDNGFGTVGVAGQIAVPMLYKYDFASYAFDMGQGIRQALFQGAQVINISAGYPCTVATTVGPDFDLCSPGGRLGICAVVTAAAHAAAIAFCASPAVAVPIAGAVICGGLLGAATAATGACLSTLALGDLRSTMASAVNAAAARGVPVVASAGNQLDPMSFPPVIRDYLALGDARLETWGVIPASLPGVIAVGAAEGSGLPNTHFYGPGVTVWAPSGAAFISPNDMGGTFTDFIGATSGAAPYVSGVIAAMQAVNPTLDPARASAAERRTAVARVRALLVSTAHSNATLSSRGFVFDAQRRNLVDPLAAVQAAAVGHLPDLAALGYDTSLNYAEVDGDDDVVARARVMPFGRPVAGTLFAFESGPLDEDWLQVRIPSGAQLFSSDVVLRYVGDDVPLLTTSGAAMPRVSSTLTGDEQVSTYRLLRPANDVVDFKLSHARGIDVPYQLSVSSPAPAVPVVTIEAPVLLPGQSVCANRPVQFRASGVFQFTTVSVPSMNWTIDGAGQPSTSLSPTFSRPAGTYTVVASAQGGSDSLVVTFADCTVVAEIVTPSANIRRYADAADGIGPYLLVSFSGRALNTMGVVIDPATLFFEWTTTRGDLQPGAPSSGVQVLGTGPVLSNLRIYGQGGSTLEIHTITLTVRASPGGAVLSTDSVRIDVQNLI